jgi:nicotinamidase-related amidase
MDEKVNESALLIMDVQTGVVKRLSNEEEYLSGIKSAVDEAHKHQIPVIYVVVGFRPGFPEVSQNNKTFKELRGDLAQNLIDPRPAIIPTEGDIVVTKRRVSAFSGSDLEIVLRAQGIRHLVLAGIATSGVVLSTVREAADKDFKLTVLTDLCADFDPEVHAILLEKVLSKQAEVMTSEQWFKLHM